MFIPLTPVCRAAKTTPTAPDKTNAADLDSPTAAAVTTTATTTDQ